VIAGAELTTSSELAERARDLIPLLDKFADYADNEGELAPEVVARIPGARLQRLPHLGHFGPLQDPDAIAQAAAAFFADVEVAAPS
jgi:pimeloyl-ACP methyl ester carboxylesterase